MTDDNTAYRVECLEKAMEGTCEKLEAIMQNHLPHIQLELEKMNGRISNIELSIKIYGGIATAVFLAITGALLKLMFGG